MTSICLLREPAKSRRRAKSCKRAEWISKGTQAVELFAL
jgi:hypothetical protein